MMAAGMTAASRQLEREGSSYVVVIGYLGPPVMSVLRNYLAVPRTTHCPSPVPLCSSSWLTGNTGAWPLSSLPEEIHTRIFEKHSLGNPSAGNVSQPCCFLGTLAQLKGGMALPLRPFIPRRHCAFVC
jgi:hypothetical protein